MIDELLIKLLVVLYYNMLQLTNISISPYLYVSKIMKDIKRSRFNSSWNKLLKYIRKYLDLNFLYLELNHKHFYWYQFFILLTSDKCCSLLPI